ncbi:MAG: PDZ domain-containing protein [Planctomycetaceae bacterium]|nr:PDZ domain-containing protein [Planctomycetaceae bacterium]
MLRSSKFSGTSLLSLIITVCVCVPCASPAHADTEYRQAMAKAVRAAAKSVLPAVVAVEIVGTAQGPSGEVEQDAPTSGVMIDTDGYVLASSIVVRRPAASILIVLPDGSRHAAKVVSRDYHRDLVLLKIETSKELSAIEFPSKLDVQIGKTTVAVGRFGNTASPIISRGVLSGVERLDGVALQTDARVSAAFYGGPLIDLYGNVMGILIPAVAGGAGSDPTGWYDSGIAFAIPSDVILTKLERLKSGTDIKRGLIGIASKTKDPYDDGTEIAAVRKRSPAEASGIKAGDEVIEIDGKTVRRHQEIKQALGRYDAGETIRIKLRRDGKEIDITTELAETIPPLQPQRLGVLVSELDSASDSEQDGEEQADDEIATVVVDSVLSGTPAESKIKAGDQLRKLGDAKISSVTTLRSLLMSAEPETEVELSITRAGNDETVRLTPAMVAGSSLMQPPKAWSDAESGDWATEELKLPDSGNAAAFVAPKATDAQQNLGLLLLLMNPSGGSPTEVLENWREAAKAAGVVICAVAPEDSRRWQPKEINAIGNFAAAVMKKAPINPNAVAVAAPGAISGTDAEAADSMALAVAVSQSSTFFGVSVSPKTRSPAMRVKENDPSASLQILLPLASEKELPEWSRGIKKAGYPVVLGGETDMTTLLNWVRLLQAI